MELNPHIKPEAPLPLPPEEDEAGIDECRLWIGNISTQITEFTLLKVVQKYGRLKKFDFLYHKSGPDQGKPRGYCFVTYETKEDAENARNRMNGKMALDRRLVVRNAHLDKREEELMRKKPSKDPYKQTELLKKTEELTTETKIRAIEAKLALMSDANTSMGDGASSRRRDFSAAYIPPPKQAVSITTQAAEAAAAAAAAAKKPSRSFSAPPRRRPHKPYNRR